MTEPEASPLTHPPPAPDFSSILRYLLFIGAAGLLLASIVLGAVFWTVPLGQALELGKFTYHENGFMRLALPLTPARYALLRGALTSSAVLGAGLFLALRRKGKLPSAWAELRHGLARLTVWWKRLPLTAKAIAIGLLATLVAVRTWYLLSYPMSTDEVASFDYFVRQGPLAISSFYPIPNNHIFFNWLAWPLGAIGLSPRLTMRLPSLVLGTLGTATGYVLLARIAGLRLATLVVGLVGLMPVWVYYAAVGRGYSVQLGMLQVGLFAALELLRPASGYRHVSWLAFISSSVLGLYTIPTYAYPLASLGLGLGVGFLVQQRWQQIAELLVSGAIIGLISLLLYLPVVAISGAHQLLGNPYVAAKTVAQFWPSYRAVLYEKAAELFVIPLRVAGPLWLGMALVGGVVIRRWYPAEIRRLGWLAWLLLAFPLLLMALQRVYAPTRTLLYISYAGYLLGALGIKQLLRRYKFAVRWRWSLIIAAILSIGGFRLYQNQAQLHALHHETQQLEQAYQCLLAQPQPAGQLTQVGMNAPMHELFFAHYAHQTHPAPALRLYAGWPRNTAIRYDFLVLGKRMPVPTAANAADFHPVYYDDLVTIYARNN